eukprot:CAMPEP_0204005086 /NCGR_PEP_ID=MMETSP0360-20130528/18827_1 /ASSEMBLY_ACC=CAM_ASM_000342 /TAXON_ID=268821 /ORGANISM="Scrippsiella Hangoei, Strain SHTV-5" /LENGTH=71 /DNA_ID=CAMNT_0050947027 /DNA_START=114 /DNA_END=329 /DNA_ORIENTATION=+
MTPPDITANAGGLPGESRRCRLGRQHRERHRGLLRCRRTGAASAASAAAAAANAADAGASSRSSLGGAAEW